MDTENAIMEIDKRNSIRSTLRRSGYRAKKSDAACEDGLRNSMVLKTLSESLAIASKIIEDQALVYEEKPQTLRIVNVVREHGYYKVKFAISNYDDDDSEEAFDDSKSLEFVFDIDRRRWSTSSKDVIDATGTNAEYIRGFVDSITGLFGYEIDDAIRKSIDEKTADLRRELLDLFKSVPISRAWSVCSELAGYIINSDGDSSSLYSDLKMFKDIELRRKKAELQKLARINSEIFDMPTSFLPRCTAEVASKSNIGPGIYFCWIDGVCVYVGKSVNISTRLRNHSTVNLNEDVGWISFDKDQIHLAELFYIWLLRPLRNHEVCKSIGIKCECNA